MRTTPLRLPVLGLALVLVAGCGGGGGGGGGDGEDTIALPLDVTFSGTMVSFGPFGDASTGGFVLVGDEYYAGDDYEDRCFLSFDLGGLPAGAEVLSAVVHLSGRVYTAGNPYLVMGSLLADHVDLGTGITGSHFSTSLANGVAVLPVFPAGLTYTPGAFSVTGSVVSDVENARPRASFRLRFSSAPYDDDDDEWVAIEVSETDLNARPTLAVTYR